MSSGYQKFQPQKAQICVKFLFLFAMRSSPERSSDLGVHLAFIDLDQDLSAVVFVKYVHNM